MIEEKVTCQTPTPGKKSTRIARWKYAAVREAILDSLSHPSEGVLFKDLAGLVGERLSPEIKRNLGSLGWYTTTVKLDLEVKGEIRRLKNSGPQRRVKC